jgi:phage-related tail protein
LIGAGTIINPIVKIVTTVVILGAVYLFIVRPVLDTTEDVVGKTQAQIAQSQRDAQQRSAEAALDAAQSRAESYTTSLQNTWAAAAREIRSCVGDAKGDLRAMERCAEFGQTAAHTLQSDYNFANSYADSLASQGRSGDAQQVRQCVEKAGFKVGPMERCRDLADRLLFG